MAALFHGEAGNPAQVGALGIQSDLGPDSFERDERPRCLDAETVHCPGWEWLRERWQRVACYDPGIPSTPPDSLPLGYLFPGAGHVYMRSAWNDPNATWAFFGCGPQFAGHARDDEGHFLICKRARWCRAKAARGTTTRFITPMATSINVGARYSKKADGDW